MSNNYTHLETDLQNLQELFKISSIANQTLEVDDFIKSISDYIADEFNIDKISFYLYHRKVSKSIV